MMESKVNEIRAAELEKSWRLSLESNLRKHTVMDDSEVSRETVYTFPYEIPSKELLDLLPPSEFFEFMEAFARLILEANKKVNLVSRRDPATQIRLNILESLPLAYFYIHISRETGKPLEKSFLMDAGSGSGVPGIPAWILLDILDDTLAPEKLLLLESRGRKAECLDWIVEEMGLEQATVLNHRLESPDLPLVLDSLGIKPAGVITSRALASIDQTVKWLKALREYSSDVVLIKGSKGLGQEWREERSRWPKRGWRHSRTLGFELVDRCSFYTHLKSV